MNTRNYILLIFCAIFMFLLPIFMNPAKLTNKDNDLGRITVPLYTFINSSFYNFGQIPLWRSEQLMGETFVGNPVSSLFYPGNILFLIFPMKIGVAIFIFTDLFLAAIFTFFLARSFNFSKSSSFAAALFYALSTKMLVHLEAGHVDIISAFAYFPLAFLAIRNLMVKISFFWLVTGALSLTFMFYSFPTIFYYALIFLLIYWFYKSRPTFEKIKPIFLLMLLTIGLSSIVLFPQLEFSQLSSRNYLTLEDVAIPLWNLKKFLISLLFPYLSHQKVDHEEFLYLGLVPMALTAIGFFKLKKKEKITLALTGLLTLTFVAGLSTPVFKLAYNFMPFLKYSRVTTRLWFVIALLVALLASYALEKFKNKKIVLGLILIFTLEATFIFYSRISTLPELSFKNEELYKILASSDDVSRVYCASSCFNAQLLSKYKIQILNGEDPIQQREFIDFLAFAGNYKWDKFAVIFPPYQVWQTPNPPIPSAQLLGKANVRYVASTYPIISPDFSPEGVFGDIHVYKNNKYLPRAYFLETKNIVKIVEYSPNRIKLHFDPADITRTLIFSENYYPGWFAYTGSQKLNVEKYNVFRKIVVPVGVQDLELKFQPQSFLFGATITISTITFLILYYFRKYKK